jgi:hypothetical protein
METFNLSDQAVAAVMMALQKGIVEQTDITELLKGFNLIQSKEGLIVVNPPQFEISTDATEAEDA